MNKYAVRQPYAAPPVETRQMRRAVDRLAMKMVRKKQRAAHPTKSERRRADADDRWPRRTLRQRIRAAIAEADIRSWAEVIENSMEYHRRLTVNGEVLTTTDGKVIDGVVAK